MPDQTKSDKLDFKKITLRPIKAKDKPFLAKLYASTRQDEMAAVPWSDEEKASFLQMQFEAQHKFYMEQFKKARFDLMLLHGTPIGRLYVDRRADEIRLIDIALLPEYRGQGIGAQFMERILSEAARKGLPVRIHVEHYNPARRLYDRLGFKEIDENGVYHLLEWQPEGTDSGTE